MSFEQQIESESKLLRQEIRNLKSSLNVATQRMQRAHFAKDMQSAEVSAASSGTGLTTGASMPLQQTVTANDDLQLILDALRRELQAKLMDNAELRAEYQSLAQHLTDLRNKNQVDVAHSQQLFKERADHSQTSQQIRAQIDEMHEKTVQMNEMHQAALRAGEQLRHQVYEQIAAAMAEKQAVEQAHYNLQARYEDLLKCDPGQAIGVVREAGQTIDMLTQKIELLTQQIARSRENQARVKESLQASLIAQHIDDQSLRRLMESPSHTCTKLDALKAQHLDSTQYACATAYTPNARLKLQRSQGVASSVGLQ